MNCKASNTTYEAQFNGFKEESKDFPDKVQGVKYCKKLEDAAEFSRLIEEVFLKIGTWFHAFKKNLNNFKSNKEIVDDSNKIA
jgi:hypothetical protein